MNLGEIMNTSNNESTSESIIANAAKGHSKQIEVNQKVNLKKKETIFILCDSCVWCATFFGKHMLLPKIDARIVCRRNFQVFQFYLMSPLYLITMKNEA